MRSRRRKVVVVVADKRLTPGSTARIFRDGGVLAGIVGIPSEGRFEVRHLPPGQYVARDECGGERAFEVKSGVEVTVISGRGEPVGPTGAPGSGHTVAQETRQVGAQPIANEFAPEHSRAQTARSRLSVEDAESDEDRTPGASGTAIVTETEFGPQPGKDEGEWRAGGPSQEDLDALEAERLEAVEKLEREAHAAETT